MSKANVVNHTNYLLIEVQGVRDSFKQVIEGSSLIARLSEQYNQTNILADYSKVIFNVKMADAFNVVRLYENQLHTFKKLKLAVITTESQSELAGFYEMIARKRGFTIKVFYEVGKAKHWLESPDEKMV